MKTRLVRLKMLNSCKMSLQNDIPFVYKTKMITVHLYPCLTCGSFELLIRNLEKCGHNVCDLCLNQNMDKECPACKIPYEAGYPFKDNNLTTLLTRVTFMSRINIASNCITYGYGEHIHMGTIVIKPLFATADPTAKVNARGKTSLHKECRSGNLEAVQTLLRTGSDINMQDFAGLTPLHEATLAGHVEVAKELLNSGALANIPGSNYLTPLHLAVQQKNTVLIKLLLEYGTDLLSFNIRGHTPFDLCGYDNDLRATLLCHVERRSHIGRLYTLPLGKVFCIDVNEADFSRFANRYKHIIGEERNLMYKGDVSYVVVGNENPNPKYIQAAMMQGACIVTANWINDYLAGEGLHLQLGYLAKIPGFAIEEAAMNMLDQLPKLFDGLHFHFFHNYPVNIGGYDYSVTDLKLLIQRGGGKLITRYPRQYPRKYLNYPYHSPKTSNLGTATHYVLYDEQKEKDTKRKFDSLVIKHRTTRWLVACINNFKILP